MEGGAHIHVARRMIGDQFEDPQTFHLVSTSGKNSNLSI